MQIAIIDGHDLTREALEKATVTTWGEFTTLNADAFSSDEYVDALAYLQTGKPVMIGGGAGTEHTIVTEADRQERLTIPTKADLARCLEWAKQFADDWHDDAEADDRQGAADALALIERCQAHFVGAEMKKAADNEAAFLTLCNEYQAWNKAQGLSLGSADEHVDDESLTEAQRTWVRDFSTRWDAVGKEV